MSKDIDIVPALLEKIENEFKNKTAKSKILKSKILALQNKNVSHIDSNAFAIEVGRILAEVFKEEITADVLPDKKMYYNIAKRLLEPNLKNNFDLVSDFSKEVQDILNQKSNISIKAISPELNQDRIDGIVNKISEYDDFEKGKWLLMEPVINFTQAIVDDTIKTNADFQYKSGLSPKIIRKEAGNCCDWCKEVVGVYEYPDVPKDVYRRHRFCRCTVDYVPGDGKIQNVHTKKIFQGGTDEELEKFREEQINNIISNKILKDKKEVDKTQRILQNSLWQKEINGVKIETISRHVAERTVLRDLKASDVIDTINNPLKITEIKYDSLNRPSFNVIGEKSTVVINPKNGNVITAHKTHTKIIKKLKGEKNENNP